MNSGRIGKAHAQYRKQRYPKCEEILNTILVSEPSIDTKALALEILGKCKYQQAQYPEAIKFLEESNKVLSSLPSFVRDESALSSIYQKTENLIESSRSHLGLLSVESAVVSCRDTPDHDTRVPLED